MKKKNLSSLILFNCLETYKYLYSRHIQANVPPPEKNRDGYIYTLKDNLKKQNILFNLN